MRGSDQHAGELMVIVDETIMAVSLPAIQTGLGSSHPGSAWITVGAAALTAVIPGMVVALFADAREPTSSA